MGLVMGMGRVILGLGLVFGGARMIPGMSSKTCALLHVRPCVDVLFDGRNISERCPGDQTNNRAELIVRFRVPFHIASMVLLHSCDFEP